MLLCKRGLTDLNYSVIPLVFSVFVDRHTRLHLYVIILLSTISSSERPVMYYIIGSLKISLSNGRCCIKRHLLIRISWRLRTVGICRIIGQDSIVLMFFLEESPFTSLKLHFWECGQIRFSEGFSLPLSARFVLNKFLFWRISPEES